MADEQEQQQGQDNPEQQKSKVKKNFDETVAKIDAILGKSTPKNGKRKIPNDKVGTIIGTLFEEENKQKEEDFKTNLKALLKNYHEFWIEVSKKEQELEKVKQDGMKNFTEAAKKVLNDIEDVPALQRSYESAFKAAVQSQS